MDFEDCVLWTKGIGISIHFFESRRPKAHNAKIATQRPWTWEHQAAGWTAKFQPATSGCAIGTANACIAAAYLHQCDKSQDLAVGSKEFRARNPSLSMGGMC
jgi:hypothetical protein